jgi:hypothetical protein
MDGPHSFTDNNGGTPQQDDRRCHHEAIIRNAKRAEKDMKRKTNVREKNGKRPRRRFPFCLE